jgi:SRSO17 transposase
MFKIVRVPAQLEPFFTSLEAGFHWDHFYYFRLLVLVMGLSWGRRNVSALYRHLDLRQGPHRTRFNNFFLVKRWDPEAALRQKTMELLTALKPRRGERLYLLIDDSKKGKRGRHMQAVSKMKDPLSGAYMQGHQYVTALIVFRGYVFPWGISLYVPKDQCAPVGVEFQKTTHRAAQQIRAFTAPNGVKVTVLFDSYYLCPPVVRACRQQGFHFISTLKSNRNLFRNGRKLKAGKYGRNSFRRTRKQHLTVAKEHGTVGYTYVDAGCLDVSNLGPLHVVFSRRGREKRLLGLVTDDPNLTDQQIIQIYGQRWWIEVFFKDSKQLLGLGQYQNGSYKAAVTHLHLVCFAYALLTHLRIQRDGAKGTKKTPTAERVSTTMLQNHLRRIVWDDLVDWLKERALTQEDDSPQGLLRELEQLLVA